MAMCINQTVYQIPENLIIGSYESVSAPAHHWVGLGEVAGCQVNGGEVRTKQVHMCHQLLPPGSP